MELVSDLNTFTKILIDKGYNSTFHTQGAYVGKLKESICEYLDNSQKGTDSLPKRDLLLMCYLQWSGVDKPYVQCNMLVKYLNGKFFLNRMEITKKDRYGQLMKTSELKSLTVVTAPKAADALALVNEKPKLKAGKSPKRFKL